MSKASSKNNLGCILLIFVLVAFLGQCVGGNDSEGLPSNTDEVSSLYDVDAAEDFQREPPSGNALDFDQGDTAYVTADSLNGRDAPSTISEVVTSIPHGNSVEVLDRSGDWMKVRASGRDVWISSAYTSRSRPAPRPRYTPQPVRSYGGTCPCSGSNVCIGPRGGRYCITSGGNKRYGV